MLLHNEIEKQLGKDVVDDVERAVTTAFVRSRQPAADGSDRRMALNALLVCLLAATLAPPEDLDMALEATDRCCDYLRDIVSEVVAGRARARAA